MDYRDALAQYIAATNTHDFANVQQLLDPAAVYWFTDKTCVSLEEIKNYFEQAWQTIQEEVYSAVDVTWIAAGEDVAVCTYTYKWEGCYKGEHREGCGRATNVFKRADGEWKLVHEHLSPL